MAGSHVQKTTDQLAELTAGLADLEQIEFHVSRALEDGGLQAEAARVRALAEASLRAGRDTLVYTSRKRMDVAGLDKERQLKLSVDISNAVTSVVAELGIQPAFIVAKGGITSSDIGVRALRVRRALVMGQIAPGVPVWRTDGESKFPYMPYVIFPGNVGDGHAFAGGQAPARGMRRGAQENGIDMGTGGFTTARPQAFISAGFPPCERKPISACGILRPCRRLCIFPRTSRNA